MGGKVTLGADASVAAGPVGRQSSAATDVGLTAQVYSYSRAMGLFAGVALDGSAMTIDNKSNESFYSRPGVLASEIIRSDAPAAPEPAGNFLAALTKSVHGQVANAAPRTSGHVATAPIFCAVIDRAGIAAAFREQDVPARRSAPRRRAAGMMAWRPGSPCCAVWAAASGRCRCASSTVALEGIGLKDVRTYIQSGNVVFRSPKSAARLAGEIERCIEKKFGFHSNTFVLSVPSCSALRKPIRFRRRTRSLRPCTCSFSRSRPGRRSSTR